MSVDASEIDRTWLAAHPLPMPDDEGTTKNDRGRVLIVGGSRKVPGALRLTAEAALRVGSGKVQMATIPPAALGLGLLVPEAAVIALGESDEGELAGSTSDLFDASVPACDAIVVGPGIAAAPAAKAMLGLVLERVGADTVTIVDAKAVGELPSFRTLLTALAGQLIVTPNHDEMAALTGEDESIVAADPEQYARRIADEYTATVILKSSSTVVAAPEGTMLRYPGGGVGLATGGSGDVLAGAIAGLSSRGASPLVAAAWGVWLHGEGGRRLAAQSGPIGFLARELPTQLPALLPR